MSGVPDGKAVVITGAGRGPGRACALLAAQEGARVVGELKDRLQSLGMAGWGTTFVT